MRLARAPALSGADMEAALAAADKCRSLLEMFWPLWKDANGFPLPPPGAAASEGCCIHSAFILRAALAAAVPAMSWTVSGGHPSPRTPCGGCTGRDGEAGQHLWVTGAFFLLPGEPRVVCDVTADQFGWEPVIVGDLPDRRYLANSPPSLIEGFRAREEVSVAAFAEMSAAVEIAASSKQAASRPMRIAM